MKMAAGAVYKVYTDGGSRGNPGAAAYGFVIIGPADEIVVQEGRKIGVTTNNQAEYQALVAGLEALAGLVGHGDRVVCYLDSQLIVRQLTEIYRVKSADLRPWLETVRQRVAALPASVEFKHIGRELNKHADALVNAALDKEGRE